MDNYDNYNDRVDRDYNGDRYERDWQDGSGGGYDYDGYDDYDRYGNYEGHDEAPRSDERYDDDYGNDGEREYDPEYEEYVREQIARAKLRREKADQLARDRLHAKMVMAAAGVIIISLIIMVIVNASGDKEPQGTYTGESSSQQVQAAPAEDTESSEAEDNESSSQSENSDIYKGQATGHQLVTKDGITHVDGIMIVNKTFSLPSDYDPGLNSEVSEAFNSMAAQAWSEGITLWICSGYRSYDEQVTLFEQYASQRGLDEADAVSARPGHSEHQTGLCIDVNTTDFSFEGTAEANWLEQHCAEYGFIIRFPKGKEKITGYDYEPWHIRYVGIEAAQQMKASGKCLEEYLNVTSDYADSPGNEEFLKKYAQYADITPADSSAADYNGNTDNNTADYNYDYNYNDNTDAYYSDDYGYGDGGYGY